MSTQTPTHLPSPSDDAKAHSEKLLDQIRQAITASGDKLSFAHYMDMALYTPNLGYYSSGLKKFGESGDFITAPEISPLFSRCIAKQCEQVLKHLDNGVILEFGAGTGVMAADILLALEAAKALPKTYYILEVSADLRLRQQATIANHCSHLMDSVTWLDHFPESSFEGVILGNEVLDAMPVHKFRIANKTIQECYVSLKDAELQYEYAAPSNPAITQFVTELQHDLLADITTYESEINMAAPSWIQNLGELLTSGMVLLIDYGFPRHEYYHPDRSMGTLMCHYQQRAHIDPLILTGLQDITAHVDFTQIAESALAAGLHVAGFTTQAHFLLACGLIDLAETMASNEQQQFVSSQAIKKLTLPSEMGELFKVIALTRDIDEPLIGFTMQDMRGRL